MKTGSEKGQSSNFRDSAPNKRPSVAPFEAPNDNPFGVADGINAIWYVGEGLMGREGAFLNAGISAAGALLPYVGDLLKFGKVGVKAAGAFVQQNSGRHHSLWRCLPSPRTRWTPVGPATSKPWLWR